ncbi:hypothetical protein DIPPA_53952 [Diplonema papillatum]|nr:hypothetical protein DIPPA_53952 [Diplonema papillatum]
MPSSAGLSIDSVSPPAGGGAKDVSVIRFVQRPGDLVFVPSSWGHFVRNLTPCLSINHNWCNRHNALRMTRLLVSEVEYLHMSLADVRDLLEDQNRATGGYEPHLEWLLHNASSWNVSSWTALLLHAVADRRSETEQAGDVLASAVACLEVLSRIPSNSHIARRALLSLVPE